MSTGAGIQELMASETRASQIVAEARLGEFSLVFVRCFILSWLILLLFQNECRMEEIKNKIIKTTIHQVNQSVPVLHSSVLSLSNLNESLVGIFM